MKILKLRKYNEGMTEAEEDALLKAKGLRRLTPDEFMDCGRLKVQDYLPCRVQTKKGLLARGCDDLLDPSWRDVLASRLPSDRLGVLATKAKKKVEKKVI